MDINYFDIAIVVIILITALIGFMRGIVWMGIFIATWVAAILIALKYKDALASALPIKLTSEVAQTGLAALLIFLGVLLAGSIINFLFSKLVSAIGLGTFDRILGMGLGIVLGGLAISLLVMLLSLTELPKQEKWQQSKFIPKFQEAAEWIKTLIPEDLNTYIDDSIGQGNSSTPVNTIESSSPAELSPPDSTAPSPTN